MWVNKNQRGAALVEFSLTFTIFLLALFGIMELSLTYFAWNRVSEAARDGARSLIVNTPLTDLSAQSCSASNPPVVTVNCNGGACPTLMNTLHVHAPFLQDSQVTVQYRCSSAGNPAVPDGNRIRDVTLGISGVPNPQVISLLGALGWQNAATLPPVTVTRTGEDLYTPAP